MGDFLKTIALSAEAKVQVYLFHHAGAGAIQYFKIIRKLPAEFQAHVVELPGRGLRANEAFIEKFDELISRVSQTFIKNMPIQPFVFIGHSMGSYVAMELYRILKLKNLPLPSLFVCTSANPPTQEFHARRERLSQLPDPDFLEKLISYKVLPEKLLQHPEFLDFFVPALKADLRLIDADSYTPDLKMECPIIGMYGDQDPGIYSDIRKQWEAFTHKGYTEALFSGGHFFFLEDIPRYTNALLEKLNEISR